MHISSYETLGPITWLSKKYASMPGMAMAGVVCHSVRSTEGFARGGLGFLQRLFGKEFRNQCYREK